MRLERDDQVILHAKLGRSVGTDRVCNPFLPVDLQSHPMRAHGLQMSAASYQADFDAGAGERCADEAADGPGTEDADFQDSSGDRLSWLYPSPCSWYTTHQESTTGGGSDGAAPAFGCPESILRPFEETC